MSQEAGAGGGLKIPNRFLQDAETIQAQSLVDGVRLAGCKCVSEWMTECRGPSRRQSWMEDPG